MEAHFIHALVKQFQTLFALRTADDFTNTRRENVHRGNGLSVVVLAHVERLDVLRVIHHGHRSTDVRLGEPTLVFALHIDAPLDGVLELHALLHSVFERGNRIGVIEFRKVGLDELLKPLDAALVDAFSEELHVVHTLGKQRTEHVLEQIFREFRVDVEISKCDLRLDHPELREVSRGV